MPHAAAFGYLIEFAELAIGIVLVGVACAELVAQLALLVALAPTLRRRPR